MKYSVGNAILVAVFVTFFSATFIIQARFDSAAVNNLTSSNSPAQTTDSVERRPGVLLPGPTPDQNTNSSKRMDQANADSSSAKRIDSVFGPVTNMNENSINFRSQPGQSGQQARLLPDSGVMSELSESPTGVVNITLPRAGGSASSSVDGTTIERLQTGSTAIADAINSTDTERQNLISDQAVSAQVDTEDSAAAQPHQLKIYEQRRLAQCQQFTEFLMRSGKSLYELDQRTRLVMTNTYNCFQ